jgi:hypothetical protein
MKLTEKDREFLERLRPLMDEKDLAIDLKDDGGVRRLVLRKNYGDKVERAFAMSRQGVRWRFHRLFSQLYPDSYEAILYIESTFGTDLRPAAMAIAKQRVELRKKAQEGSSISGQRR